MTHTLNPTILKTSLLALAISGIANAEPLEEVIVSGELRSTEQLQLANSVSVITEQLIEVRNAKSLEDLLNLAPNVNFSTGASRGRFIQIRGIGERSQFVAPSNPSVGIIVDGIDFTGLGMGVTTLDTAQVEIFRGPQGTLYGANALAGMINVVGNAPDKDGGGKVSAGFGNYGSYDVGGNLSIPVGDSAGWRMAVQKNVSDGYIDNVYLGRNDTNNIDEVSFRNHFSFDISNELKVDLISYIIDIDNGYDAFSLDNDRTTLSDQPGHDRQQTNAHALKAAYSGLGFADLQANVSYADSQVEYGYDEDWTYRDICTIDSTCAYWQYSTADNYLRDNRNKSADVRLLSKENDGGMQWVVGVYYRDQQVALKRTYTDNAPDDDFYSDDYTPVFSVYSSEYITKNAALYGQVDFPLADSLTLVTGLRYENFDADFKDSDSTVFGPSENLFGGKIALELSLSDDTLLYGLISRGYKAGGFNAEPRVPQNKREYDTELAINYELGMKGDWLENSLLAQVSAFYQQRKGVQVNVSEAEAVDDFVIFLDNAAEGYNTGLEVELTWLASDALSLSGSFALLNTEHEEFLNVSHVDGSPAEPYDMSGRDQAHAPNYQYYVAAQYDLLSNLYFRVDMEGKDGFYFSESHEERSDSIDLLNARLGFDVGMLSLAVWAKNLTDEWVETRGFYFSHDFGNDPRKFYAAEPYTQKGAPRTFGVSASYTF